MFEQPIRHRKLAAFQQGARFDHPPHDMALALAQTRFGSECGISNDTSQQTTEIQVRAGAAPKTSALELVPQRGFTGASRSQQDHSIPW